jgi:hypothetical protein
MMTLRSSQIFRSYPGGRRWISQSERPAGNRHMELNRFRSSPFGWALLARLVFNRYPPLSRSRIALALLSEGGYPGEGRHGVPLACEVMRRMIREGGSIL